MDVRITQVVSREAGGNPAELAGQLSEHAARANELSLVEQADEGTGRIRLVYEGFATGEPDAGHRALNNRTHAQSIGLRVEGTRIEVVRFPEERDATWPEGHVGGSSAGIRERSPPSVSIRRTNFRAMVNSVPLFPRP